MDCPQSPEDWRPIEAAIQRRAPQLYLAWNPRARVVRPGAYDVHGRPIPPAYDGRWELRYKADDGYDGLCCRLEWEAGEDPAHRQGDYRPVGWWLVEKLACWDVTSPAYEPYRNKLWAEHERTEQTAHLPDPDEAHDFWERQAARLQRSTYDRWIGRGATFSTETP